MKFEYSSLLNEFALHFPNIDFSDVDSGYDQVERKLLDHIKEFTPEQWQVICDYTYDNLFQNGTPHYSWNTDRASICCALIKNLMPYKTYSEFWYDIEHYSIQMNGCVLEVKIEEPRSFSSSSRTKYFLKVAEVYQPVPTHRAVILRIGSDTKVYIKDQYAGSLNECEEWVSKNINSTDHFKIMAI